MCQKVENLERKMTQNRLKTSTFSFFFSKKQLLLKENEKDYSIFCYKIEIPTNFMHLRLKMTMRDEFRFQNSLNLSIDNVI